MITKLVLVFIGGGIGSCLRYGLSWFIPYTSVPSFPTATFLANVLAALILGIATGSALKNGINESVALFLMVGLCGGFSTFSAFSKEVLQLLEVDAYVMAIVYVIASISVCVLVIFLSIAFQEPFFKKLGQLTSPFI